jgi:hypothetical protein
MNPSQSIVITRRMFQSSTGNEANQPLGQMGVAPSLSFIILQGSGVGARRLDGHDRPVRSEPAADNGAPRPTGAERKDERLWR